MKITFWSAVVQVAHLRRRVPAARRRPQILIE
jgi:hypothetical protein